MASTRMIIAASGATLFLSTVCSTAVLAQAQQTQSTATTTTSTQQADQQGEASAAAPAQTTTNQAQSTQPAPVQAAPTPAVPAQATPAPAAPTQAGMPPGSSAPAVAPGTTVPGTVVPGTVVPGTVAPGAAVPAAPGAYVPKTQYDNTPSRFDMTQDGKRMSADDFDTWMRSRGFRVAKGKPPADCVNAPPAGVETIVGPDGCPVEISIKLDGVTFEFAKNTLRPEAKKTLDQAVEILKRHPELTVEVAGHTDSRGAEDFNQKLSQTRAKTVYDYLIEKGIDAKQLEGPVGYGESKPIASNDTDAGRDQNRRTELNVKAVAALPAPAAGTGAPPVVLPAKTEGAEGQAEAPAPATPAPAATPPAADATAPAASTPAATEPAAEAEKPATPTP
jgi:outer membrane protein OmpA-like peptidoglycan-associated protein